MVSLSFLAVDRVETVVLLARPSGSTREKKIKYLETEI